MLKKSILLVSAFVLGGVAATLAAQAEGITIFAAEMGIGKFHREDNRVHPYANDNAWKPFVLPDNADVTAPILKFDNADGSVTIFYASLEELLLTAKAAANARGQKIEVINLNAHGMPGGMWFPKDAKQRDSKACSDWVEAAQGSDTANYNQYYSPISKFDVLQMRAISKAPAQYSCIAGLPEWQEIVGRHADLKSALADNFQLHLMSCIVGLGPVGDAFTRGLAALLLNHPEGRIESALQFGLGDWSMPEGMGFWDYLDDAQLDRDNAIYPVTRTDREIMQLGDIRVAQIGDAGATSSGLIQRVDFMPIGLDQRSVVVVPEEIAALPQGFTLPDQVRLPGTKVWVKRSK